MSGESFEWAIKKDVRNNPIVREVDLERHRDMWRSVGFSVFLVVVLVFAAWQQFELKRYGYRMEETQKLLEEEGITGRRLRLELEMLRSPAFVEPAARRRLHMVEPGPGESTVIERVFEAPAPPQSVVAQR
jgi:cell division protein FtsB